ncbi:MAG: hypothetical protein ACR2RA_15525 [Geminicoccaceae bacterium]
MRSLSLSAGLGLLLIVVGAVHAAGAFFDPGATEALMSRPIRASMLAIALIISCLGVAEGRRWPAMIDVSAMAICVIAGLPALWQFAAGPDAPSPPDWLHPWTGLLGCAALLTACWRMGSPWLALTGALAVTHVAIGDAREAGWILWFGLDEGALGWVFGALSSWGLLLILSGGLIAGSTSIGGSDHDGDQRGRLIAALYAVCRFLVPPLAIGSLLMTLRPGIDPVAILPVWIAAIGIGLIWFRFMPANGKRARHPAALLDTLGETGVAFGRLLVQAGVIGMVLAAFDRSGLPFDIAQILAGGLGEAWLPLTLFAALLTAGFGMAISGIAAYPIAVTLLAPALRTVGLDTSTIHLLILLVSAVASAQAASGSETRGRIGSALFGNAASR